jgi:hypothetical protein
MENQELIQQKARGRNVDSPRLERKVTAEQYANTGIQTYLGHPALHPKTLLGIALKREQGEMIMDKILPERSVPNKEFVYREYGDIGGLAHEVGEGAPTPLRGINYKEVLTRCVELREGTLVTEQSQQWLDRDIVKDAVEDLTDVISLKQESMAFETLLDETKYDSTQVLTLNASETWGDPANRPQDALSKAKAAIRKIGHIKPDTLIINSDDEGLLERSLPLNVWSNIGPYSQQLIEKGAIIGKIAGLDIFSTDAVRWTSADDDTLLPMLSNSAIVLKRGSDLGFTAIAEPFTVRRFPVPDRRALEIQTFKTIRPVITRRTHVCIIKNTDHVA